MVARQDRTKVHKGRRKQGSRKRRKAWLCRNKLRVRSLTNQKQRRRNAIGRLKYRTKKANRYNKR